MRRLVIPIRNREDPFFEVAPWFLGPKLSVDEISGDDFSALFRDEEDVFKPILSPKTQCFTVELAEDADARQVAYQTVTKAQFVFKSLGVTPLVVSHAVVIVAEEKKKAVVDVVLDLPVWGDSGRLAANAFKFKESITLEQVIQLYDVVSKALEKQESLLLTLNRFNSCWLREIDHDRIIDAAICLESIIASSTEISFKFSLFNAFTARSEPKERQEAFEKFKALYDARSKIVHGDVKSHKKKIDALMASFDVVLELAHAAITYYVLYVFSRDPGTWADHLEGLVFNTEAKINDEPTKDQNG